MTYTDLALCSPFIFIIFYLSLSTQRQGEDKEKYKAK